MSLGKICGWRTPEPELPTHGALGMKLEVGRLQNRHPLREKTNNDRTTIGSCPSYRSHVLWHVPELLNHALLADGHPRTAADHQGSRNLLHYRAHSWGVSEITGPRTADATQNRRVPRRLASGDHDLSRRQDHERPRPCSLRRIKSWIAPGDISQACSIGTYSNSPERHKVRRQIRSCSFGVQRWEYPSEISHL
jgi:hypothetical protein